MDENYHKPIGLDIISRQACISRFHFHRLFTRIYRQTLHSYLTQKRITQAQQLLTESDLPISEVCSSVGFESIGSFSILFKKETGLAPGHYRDHAFRKKQQAKIKPAMFIPHCFIDSGMMNP